MALEADLQRFVIGSDHLHKDSPAVAPVEDDFVMLFDETEKYCERGSKYAHGVRVGRMLFTDVLLARTKVLDQYGFPVPVRAVPMFEAACGGYAAANIERAERYEKSLSSNVRKLIVVQVDGFNFAS